MPALLQGPPPLALSLLLPCLLLAWTSVTNRDGNGYPKPEYSTGITR
jgi:hypothetical protein